MFDSASIRGPTVFFFLSLIKSKDHDGYLKTVDDVSFLLEIQWLRWRSLENQQPVCMDFGLFLLSYLFRNPICIQSIFFVHLPTTFKLKVWLSLGTVETWHSNLPASRAVTYFNLSVHRPCRDGINSYLSSWTKRSRPMKSICASTLRTHDT